MKPIQEIIQGAENTLFDRVSMFLQSQGLSKRFLDGWESHRQDNLDDLLDASYNYLEAVGCY
jgi:hypothetical protein